MIRPTAYLRAFRDPAWPFRMAYVRYRLARGGCSQIEFITTLGPDDNQSLTQGILADLQANKGFLDHIERCMSSVPETGSGRTPGWVTLAQGEVLYALVRALRPSTVVETGVAHGVSSSFLLKGLDDNGVGTLYSIDRPPKGRMEDGFEYQMAGHDSGWMVPNELRDRWHLLFGDSKSELPRLLQELDRIDLFLHDGEHTLENMRFEYQQAWDHLNEGGLLLSDDINLAFVQLCDKISRPLVRYDRMGGVRK